MLLPNQFDGVVTDSLARGDEARPVAGALRFQKEIGDRREEAFSSLLSPFSF